MTNIMTNIDKTVQEIESILHRKVSTQEYCMIGIAYTNGGRDYINEFQDDLNKSWLPRFLFGTFKKRV